MNITDLRSALRERAADVNHHDPVERVSGVHARVRRVRRRRIAGVGALTVGALVIVGAVSVLPSRGGAPDRTGPAARTDPPVIHHDNFVSHSGGFDLIAAKVGKPGRNTLDIDVPAHRGELYVSMVCWGHGGPDGYWVSGYTGDSRPARPASNWCRDEPMTPVVPMVRGEAPGPWNYDPGLTIGPDDRATVHLELTQEVDESGVPIVLPTEEGDHVLVTNPDTVLGVALYTVADPIAEVAGTMVPSRVGLNGQDYAYVRHLPSTPGTRVLTWTLDPSTEERYYDVIASNAVVPNKKGQGAGVNMSLDGDNCRVFFSSATFRTGGCLLSPGEPHTITVTVSGDLPAGTALAIVLYQRSG
jgi:hypothetical protein